MTRPARPADGPALRRLQSHLSEPAPDLLAAGVDGVLPCFVSTAGDRPVGYVLAVPGDRTAHVAELVVAPDRRREGRATRLVERVAADADRLTVAVAADNDAARAFYRGLGFEERRREPDFFEGGPAVVLTR